MPIASFADMLSAIQGRPPKKLAVAAAEDPDVIEAVHRAAELGIAEPLLVGRPAAIEEIIARQGIAPSRYCIRATDSPEEAAALAVELVRTNEAEVLMKGHLPTPTLLRAVLHRERGLRTGKALSHVALVELSSYPKVLLATDGGINIQQDLAIKLDIVHNAVGLARRYGREGAHAPRVAMLALVETVEERLPETGIAAEIAARATDGLFGDAIVEGPVALDVALSAQAAAKKGLKSLVAGETDILVGANITATNHVVKALVTLAGAKAGGIVLGAGAPIVLLSRSDSSETKMNSLLAALA